VTVILGIDRVIASNRLAGKRVGLVCNAASVDADFQHSADRLAAATNVSLGSLFGPQHGFHSDVQDNMIETPHACHRRYDIPIYSLYSNSREPTPAMLADLDLLVIDLQDVGTRVYTYVYTMANCLRAAKRDGLPVIVCDRPNPIGGEAVEGPMLHPGYESFVGQAPIPLRHGLTIGELARLFNGPLGIGADLDIIPLKGWSRTTCYDSTGLPWIIPSPNLPTLESTFVYPGSVLFEGTLLSEGRGTTRPFELIGAPWIDADALTQHLNVLGLPGVHFRPTHFEPTFQKHCGQTCGGCQIHITDRRVFKPVLTAVALLQACRRSAPERFGWRQPPYEYEHDKMPIDILSGSDQLRLQIDSDLSAWDIAREWEAELKAFDVTRRNSLLY
jgi:uncharacterized protein YbbC (DUF1343 family)